MSEHMRQLDSHELETLIIDNALKATGCVCEQETVSRDCVDLYAEELERYCTPCLVVLHKKLAKKQKAAGADEVGLVARLGGWK